MGKDANALRKQILDAASVHPRVGALFRFNAGWFRAKTSTGTRPVEAGPIGWPDLAGWMAPLDGRLLLVELKAGKDKLRQSQIEMLNNAKRDGCVVIVARSVKDFVRGVEEA